MQDQPFGLSAPVPAIYPLLADHQRNERWPKQNLFAVLLEWMVRFNIAFKLNIPEIALCIDRLRITRYGHFRYGHNGFGLKGEIAINERYLSDQRPSWQILGTLLHELLHAWQQEHGTPGRGNYHNAEFREKALQLGLIIDRRGVTQYAETSPFKDLLAEHGVDISELPRPVMRQAGESKLKKWVCGCGFGVRVAVADFRARCLECGQVFRRVNSNRR